MCSLRRVSWLQTQLPRSFLTTPSTLSHPLSRRTTASAMSLRAARYCSCGEQLGFPILLDPRLRAVSTSLRGTRRAIRQQCLTVELVRWSLALTEHLQTHQIRSKCRDISYSNYLRSPLSSWLEFGQNSGHWRDKESSASVVSCYTPGSCRRAILHPTVILRAKTSLLHAPDRRLTYSHAPSCLNSGSGFCRIAQALRIATKSANQ